VRGSLHIGTRGESPSPEGFAFDLSPQAGRGKEEERYKEKKRWDYSMARLR